MCPTTEGLQILLVEDNADATEAIENLLATAIDVSFNLVSVRSLNRAIETLSHDFFDIVLLDLSLSDSNILDSIIQIKEQNSTLPIIVLSQNNDKQLALEAVRQGAQDYLLKSQLNGDLLIRTINYAIERQRIKDELQQQIARERVMRRMIQRIRYSLDLRTILETTVDEVRQFLNSDRVMIYSCQDNQTARIVAESVDVIDAEKTETNLALINLFLQTPTFAYDSYSLMFSNLSESTQLIQPILNAILAVPIWHSLPNSEPVLWGQLIAQDTKRLGQWQPWEIEFLTQLADQVAIAIQQSELYQAVEKLAILDGLTQIPNRRHFDQVLQSVWDNLSTTQEPLSMIMIDVDFFSEYNNTYGHLAGDDCLKQIALILQQACQRAADVACRYGGEEFVIILARTDSEGALTVAQHIQQHLKQLQLVHRSSPVSGCVTLSMGIATCIPTSEGVPANLIELADHALRLAKQEGRDRIVIYPMSF